MLTGLLVATLVADGVTRALPIDWLTFRPWEAAVQYRPPDAAFEPNRRITCDRCYGDLASMANLPRYRVYRREVFTTDGWGFRNADDMGGRPVRVLLAGDSFAAGAALTDTETLAAGLGDRIGGGVYNTAPMIIGATGLKALAAHLKISEGVVLVQHLGWAVTPTPDTDDPRVPHAQPTIPARERFVRSFSGDLFPLRILANQAVKPLQNDHLLANPGREFATVEELADGQPMLFRTADVAVWGGARPPFDAWAVPRFRDNGAYYLWLRDQMAGVGLKLVVLLVPHKFTVYQPFLRSTVVSTRTVDPYLPRLAEALRNFGLTVIDLSEAFYKAAEAGLATGQPIYWPDDTHWNPRGAALAADVVAEAIGPLLPATSNRSASPGQ